MLASIGLSAGRSSDAVASRCRRAASALRASVASKPPPAETSAPVSDDVLCSGLLRVRQGAAKGSSYRFGLDSLLLASDPPECVDLQSEGSLVVDLGAGCGVAGLCVALAWPSTTLLAVERQASLAALCRHNLAQLGARAVVKETDIRNAVTWLPSPGSAAYVLCNPPFFLSNDALATTSERLAARHEMFGSLADFVRATDAALANTSRAAGKFVFPPSRLPDLFAALAQCKKGGNAVLRCSSLRYVHASASEAAHLVEAVLKRNPPELQVRPPLYVRGDDGRYTEEVARRIAGAAGGVPSEEEVERVRGTCARPPKNRAEN